MTDPWVDGLNILYQTNAGALTLWRRDDFCDVGGFDATFVGWGGEDDDLLARALRLGKMAVHLSDKRLFHLHHDSATRAGWDRRGISEANCQRAVENRAMDDNTFATHVTELKQRLSACAL
jgi:GT2 family glycosyltransferase